MCFFPSPLVWSALIKIDLNDVLVCIVMFHNSWNNYLIVVIMPKVYYSGSWLHLLRGPSFTVFVTHTGAPAHLPDHCPTFLISVSSLWLTSLSSAQEGRLTLTLKLSKVLHRIRSHTVCHGQCWSLCVLKPQIYSPLLGGSKHFLIARPVVKLDWFIRFFLEVLPCWFKKKKKKVDSRFFLLAIFFSFYEPMNHSHTPWYHCCAVLGLSS